MHIGTMRGIEAEDLTIPGVRGAKIRWLIGEREGAKEFAMRVVTLEKGGEIPLHAHSVTHQQFILNGTGAVLSEEGETEVGPGDFVFVPADEKHGLRNTGDEDFELICCINLTGAR
jgi:quercetin dioxygenase-like cupin family protein